MSLICSLFSASPPFSLYLHSAYAGMCICIYHACVFVPAPVYASSGLGPGRDNEIITLIKPLQTEWSSLFPLFLSSLLSSPASSSPLSASALVSHADSLTDSCCHSDASARASVLLPLLKRTGLIQLCERCCFFPSPNKVVFWSLYQWLAFHLPRFFCVHSGVSHQKRVSLVFWKHKKTH